METFFIALAFVAGFLLIFGVNLMLADMHERQREAVRRQLEEEFRAQRKDRVRKTGDKKLHEMMDEGLATINTNPSYQERVQRMLDESGLTWRPGQLLGLSGAIGILVATTGWAITGGWIAPVVAFPLGGVLPILYVATLRARRLEKLRSQLPDAFD